MNYELDCLWELLSMLCSFYLHLMINIKSGFFLSMQKYFIEAVESGSRNRSICLFSQKLVEQCWCLSCSLWLKCSCLKPQSCAAEEEEKKESMATIAWLTAAILLHCIAPHVCCSMGHLTELGISLSTRTNNLKPSHPQRSWYMNVHFGPRSAPVWMFHTLQSVFPRGETAHVEVCVLQYVLLAIESQHLNGIFQNYSLPFCSMLS